jgi:hypothetical protein
MLSLVAVLALALSLVCAPGWVSSFSANVVSNTPSAQSQPRSTPKKIKNCCEAGICCAPRNKPPSQ